jgi:hypothetical protein
MGIVEMKKSKNDVAAVEGDAEYGGCIIHGQ